MGQRTLSPLRRLARAWYNGSLERGAYLHFRQQLLDALEQGLPPPAINPPERRPAATATEQTTQRVPAQASRSRVPLVWAAVGLLSLVLAMAWWAYSTSGPPASSDQPAGRSNITPPIPGRESAAKSAAPRESAQSAQSAPDSGPPSQPGPPAPLAATPADMPQRPAVPGAATASMEARLREFMRAGQWNDSQAHSALIIQWLDLSPPQIEALRGTATFRAFADALNAKVREARLAKKHEVEAQLERLADRLGIRLPQAGALGGAQLRASSGCGKASLASGRLFCRDRLPHGGPAPLMQALRAPPESPAPYAAVSAAPLDSQAFLAFCRHSGRACGKPQAPAQAEASAYAAWLSEVTGHPYLALTSETLMKEAGLLTKPARAGAVYLALSRE